MEFQEIIDLLNKTNLTDKELAREFKVSVPTIHRWRNNINQPTPLAWDGIKNKLENILDKIST